MKQITDYIVEKANFLVKKHVSSKQNPVEEMLDALYQVFEFPKDLTENDFYHRKTDNEWHIDDTTSPGIFSKFLVDDANAIKDVIGDNSLVEIKNQQYSQGIIIMSKEKMGSHIFIGWDAAPTVQWMLLSDDVKNMLFSKYINK